MRFPFSRRTKTVKVEEPFSNLAIFDVKKFSELKSINKTILESDMAFFAVDPEGYFMCRLRKRNFKPSIRQVQSVAFQPDQNIVELNSKELLQLASDINSELLETEDSLILLTNGIIFLAKLTEGR